ncbi:MAG: MerR family transcriptional regulator [Sphingomonadaceae bacterium]
MSDVPYPDSDLPFDDGKDEEAFRTIGEVSAAVGIKSHVLRYWEEQFPLLCPIKRSGGRRYYRPEDIALIRTIDSLVNIQGYTLKGARQAIENEGVPTQKVESANYSPRNDGPADMSSGEATGDREASLSGAGSTGAGNSDQDHPALVLKDAISRLKKIREELSNALAA